MNSSQTSAWIPEIDIHCHALPAWDDGPKTVEEALALARSAAQAGVTTIVATPHIGRSFRDSSGRKRTREASEIPGGVARFQREIDVAGIPIRLVPGGEILLGSVDLHERLPHDLPLTYAGGGKYALVESPFPMWPDFGNSVVAAMDARGVRAVLAHPERYADVQKNIATLAPSIQNGALVQITADALAGRGGKSMRACCHALLRAGYVSFVASDAHSDAAKWGADVVADVVKIVGEEAARAIFVENPRRLLAGERVMAPHIESAPPTGLLGRLLGRGR